jgi:hypothetical protein
MKIEGSGVAKATLILRMQLVPALKGRAKLNSPLRGGNDVGSVALCEAKRCPNESAVCNTWLKKPGVNETEYGNAKFRL